MRDILFRYWDVNDQAFHNWTDMLSIADLPHFQDILNNSDQYIEQQSIDDIKVFAGDLLAFPGDDHLYTVKWLQEEGAWGIMYDEQIQMGRAGMARLMQIRGNIYESKEEISHEN